MQQTTDSGVRKGLYTTEFLAFCVGGAMVLLNGTDKINVPWDTLTDFFWYGAIFIGGRAGQKTVATWSSARSMLNKALNVETSPNGERKEQ